MTTMNKDEREQRLKQIREALEPCWCRSKTTSLRVESNMDHGHFGCRERGRYVYCSNCWVHGPTFTTDEEAIEGWNKSRLCKNSATTVPTACVEKVRNLVTIWRTRCDEVEPEVNRTWDDDGALRIRTIRKCADELESLTLDSVEQEER